MFSLEVCVWLLLLFNLMPSGRVLASSVGGPGVQSPVMDHVIPNTLALNIEKGNTGSFSRIKIRK